MGEDPEGEPPALSCLRATGPAGVYVNMFGGVAAKVNGQMFDPMGNGRIRRDTVFLPESVMAEPDELRAWIRRTLDYTAALPATKRLAARS